MIIAESIKPITIQEIGRRREKVGFEEKIFNELVLIRKELQAIQKYLEPEEPPYVKRWINGNCVRVPREADPQRRNTVSDTSRQRVD